MTASYRVTNCPECSGVMRSVWSDGKTRIHAMRCLRCDHEKDLHQRRLDYIECRHGDPLADLDTEADWSKFMDNFEEYRLERTVEAFQNPPEANWSAVQIRNNDSGYTVAAYAALKEPGDGIGDEERMPYGTPDVSWTADRVYVNDSKVVIEDVNQGTAYVYLTFVHTIDLQDRGNLVRIDAG